MGRKSKRFRETAALVDSEKLYTVEEAVDILKKCPSAKFDESVEVSLVLGIDPRKADQQVRSTVALPNGTGKTLRVLVFAKGDKATEATDAGADFVGTDEVIDQIKGGWTDFDAVVATPDMMREVGKLGKVLGPRGLMPTPKAGTVTPDVAKAVKDLKGGKVEFRADKHSCVNNLVGKKSFEKEALVENILAFLNAVHRSKPSGAKGVYMKTMSISSTMGPGMKIDLKFMAAM